MPSMTGMAYRQVATGAGRKGRPEDGQSPNAVVAKQKGWKPLLLRCASAAVQAVRADPSSTARHNSSGCFWPHHVHQSEVEGVVPGLDALQVLQRHQAVLGRLHLIVRRRKEQGRAFAQPALCPSWHAGGSTQGGAERQRRKRAAPPPAATAEHQRARRSTHPHVAGALEQGAGEPEEDGVVVDEQNVKLAAGAGADGGGGGSRCAGRSYALLRRLLLLQPLAGVPARDAAAAAAGGAAAGARRKAAARSSA